MSTALAPPVGVGVTGFLLRTQCSYQLGRLALGVGLRAHGAALVVGSVQSAIQRAANLRLAPVTVPVLADIVPRGASRDVAGA